MEFPTSSKWIFENETFKGIEQDFKVENDVYDGAGLELIFRWVNLNELDNLRLYPLFLRKSLKNIKPYPEHIINHDD